MKEGVARPIPIVVIEFYLMIIRAFFSTVSAYAGTTSRSADGINERTVFRGDHERRKGGAGLMMSK